MGSIKALSVTTFKENLSKNLLSTNMFFLVALVLFSVFVQDMKDDFGKFEFFLDGAIFFLNAFTLFYVVACTFPLIEWDKSANRLAIYLSSYVNRSQYLIGKYCGAVLSVFTNYAVMCTIVSLFSWMFFKKHPSWLFGIYVAGLFEFLFLIAILLLLSFSLSRFMALMTLGFIFLVGHFTYYLNYYLKMNHGEFTGIVKWLYFLFPNFEYYGLKNAYLTLQSVPISYYGYLLAYTFGWIFVVYLLGVKIFSKKEL
jgi:hypothetical protein